MAEKVSGTYLASFFATLPIGPSELWILLLLFLTAILFGVARSIKSAQHSSECPGLNPEDDLETLELISHHSISSPQPAQLTDLQPTAHLGFETVMAENAHTPKKSDASSQDTQSSEVKKLFPRKAQYLNTGLVDYSEWQRYVRTHRDKDDNTSFQRGRIWA